MSRTLPSSMHSLKNLSTTLRPQCTVRAQNICCCIRSPINHHIQHRPISTSPFLSRPAKTIEQTRGRHRSGPFSPTAAVIFFVAGAGLIYYFRTEKARIERKKIAEQTKGIGKPKVGGPFNLKDHEGRSFTEEDLKGGFSIVYFGFTHCPDICPDELDKLSRIIDLVNTKVPASISQSRFLPPTSSFSTTGPSTPTSPTPSSNEATRTPSSSPKNQDPKSQARAPILPIFISCDPARDTPDVLSRYLREFHPGIIGLSGTWEQTKDVCKAYRVYFSTPPDVKAGEDYLVDHSIYFYLMDPEGDFVEAIGRQHTAEAAAKLIQGHMGDWEKGVARE